MKILLILGSIFIPLLMVVLQRKWLKSQKFFHLAAILSALIFGNISSTAIYNIIKDDTVFMTNIHSIFLNPFFLITGAYLGLYVLYILILQFFNQWFRDNI
ncbi:transposase [Neobacillus cucumis]|uniref:Transposase n=2 Tax=Neobacillus cucumis TaxID=1740721 RepID=A0A2N5HAB5_9BACI|nr:transposase [Neobacillus cucumis]